MFSRSPRIVAVFMLVVFCLGIITCAFACACDDDDCCANNTTPHCYAADCIYHSLSLPDRVADAASPEFSVNDFVPVPANMEVWLFAASIFNPPKA